MNNTYPRFYSLQKLIVLLILTASVFTHAQYFGKNKVQYEKFDFKVLHSEPFRVFYYPSESLAVYDATRMLHRWQARYEEVFSKKVSSDQPIILYANHADFQQTNVISGSIPQSTGGVTEGLRNRVVIPLTGVYAENDHVLGHELVHVYHYEILKSSPEGLSGASQLPLWFIEGMAEYLSVGSYGPLTSMWLRDGMIHNDLPSVRDMSGNPSYFPYRFGHGLWAYLAGMYGDSAVASLYRASIGLGVPQAIENMFDIDTDSLTTLWHEAIEERYGPTLKGRINPGGFGVPVVEDQGGTNLSPSISPDGKYVAFFSTKDVFSLSLYLAETKTGKIVKRLTRAQSNPHFDALRFVRSSGAWSPDGKQIAFVVFKNGDNQIAIFDVDDTKVIRNISLDTIDGLTGLAWSPDGKRIAISGTQGGISDLYVYNLETESTRQITRGKYAEIQPTWSPDGSSLAFVTDRGPATNFDSLTYEKANIALMDLETDVIRLIRMGPDIKHISPQYSSDGKSVYFVADPDGFSNIYRYSLEEEAYYRVTNIVTGVSGLTELSPALTVARENDILAFNVFEHRKYNIYRLTQQRISEEPFEVDIKQRASNILLPGQHPSEGRVSYLLNQYMLGLRTSIIDSIDRYDPSLGLVSIGQLVVGATVGGEFGSGIGGAITMLFSDLMGDHLLGVAAQINGSIQDIGAQVSYYNRGNRFNWGANAAHIPYISVFQRFDLDTTTVQTQNTDSDSIVQIDTTRTIVEQRTFVDEVSLTGSYPFSPNRRIEANLGYTYVWYQAEGQEGTIRGDQVVGQTDVEPQTPSPLNMYQASAALVGDYSLFGFTSPISGRRYRLEVEPTLGTLQFLTVIGDYRHYFLKNPLTLAVRGLHYGRYFQDAESSRLTPLFLGYGTLVRGYSFNSFTDSDCREIDGQTRCPTIERLIGSRMAVFNAEARVPILGTRGYGLIDFPYVPLTLSAFVDAGAAWTAGELPEPSLERATDDRIPVISTGAALRVNVLGLLVLQWYYAYPFQHPSREWQLGFVIAPGW